MTVSTMRNLHTLAKAIGVATLLAFPPSCETERDGDGERDVIACEEALVGQHEQ
jgi:hypothetical protein